MTPDLKREAWLNSKPLLTVFDALEAAGGEVRVNGGAVRNSLMGIAVADVDLSTTLVPAQTIKALEAAGIRAIATGIEHGTITAVAGKTPFEITTLREDIETNGRHAVVRFGTDWELDAKRRDLTINALYCDRHGILYDPLNGLDDVKNRHVRFIGDAGERITEDHLRILRFFRFFAWYGAARPDGDGLKACAKLKGGLENISVERIWMELRKTLKAPDPSRSLLWMRTTGVLGVILPESEKWGIDLVPHLIAAEQKWRWKPDAMVRLAAMMRPDGEIATGVARRLKFSGDETRRLVDWAQSPLPRKDCDEVELAKSLYLGDPQAILDKMKLEIARLAMTNEEGSASAKSIAEHVKYATKWKRPVFPVKGQDILNKGIAAGPEIGALTKKLEKLWVDSGFKLSKAELLKIE